MEQVPRVRASAADSRRPISDKSTDPDPDSDSDSDSDCDSDLDLDLDLSVLMHADEAMEEPGEQWVLDGEENIIWGDASAETGGCDRNRS